MWERKPALSRKLSPRASGWATLENEKDTTLTPIRVGSIYCSSVWSPTPSHSKNFSNTYNKVRGRYFSKGTLARISSSLCCYDYEYTTISVSKWSLTCLKQPAFVLAAPDFLTRPSGIRTRWGSKFNDRFAVKWPPASAWTPAVGRGNHL